MSDALDYLQGFRKGACYSELGHTFGLRSCAQSKSDKLQLVDLVRECKDEGSVDLVTVDEHSPCCCRTLSNYPSTDAITFFPINPQTRGSNVVNWQQLHLFAPQGSLRSYRCSWTCWAEQGGIGGWVIRRLLHSLHGEVRRVSCVRGARNLAVDFAAGCAWSP